MDTKHKRIIIRCTITFSVIAVLLGIMVYLLDYYPADESVLDYMSGDGIMTVISYGDGSVAFEPYATDIGFIFYPGGKVEYTAYVPLLKSLAEQGILCILVKMPFNLAVFDVNAADGLKMRYPDIEHWYIGGHSLGGSMAAAYLKDNAEYFDGLILLASYSTQDLSGTDLNVISVYGSNDGVLNIDKYEKYRSNLPESMSELVIDGGCHSYFGFYGEQKGDGEADITAEEQISITSEYLVKKMII